MQAKAVIDAHAHCGAMDRSWDQDYADYARMAADTDICGAAFFSPVMAGFRGWLVVGAVHEDY